MKKRLLILILALALVLVFSSLALAADNFSVTSKVESGKFVEQAASGYTYYTDASKVTLTLTPDNGYSLYDGDTPLALIEGRYEFDLTSEGKTIGVGPTPPADPPADYQPTAPVEYTFKLVKIDANAVKIESYLYNGNSAAAETYDKEGSDILVPLKTKPYVKITAPDGIPLTISGADIPNTDGYAALEDFDDFTTSAKVTVKLGQQELASESFSLLRPTLEKIYFNGKASNSGRNTLTNDESGVYEFSTADYIDADWNPVYYKITPLCEGASVTVKQGSTTLTPSSGWYGQNMTQAPYKRTVTITVGKEKTVSQNYTLYLMSEGYSGPAVKSFKASEKADGNGDSYLTVVDEEAKTVHIFLPEDADGFFVAVTMDGKIDPPLKLAGDTIEEEEWNEYSASELNNKKLSFKDVAGIEYSYKIEVHDSADADDTDASLKSLKVRSGSKQSTSDNVEIGFDPKVLDYAFSVAGSDVYLNIAAAAKDSDATVFINGQQVTSLTVDDLATDEATEFDILVVAGDNKTTQTYTVTVNGSIGPLNTLSASNIKGLTPSFKPEINTYTGYTNPGTVSTLITALAKNYSSDIVQISKANFNSYGQSTSYTALTKAVQGGTSVTGELKTGTNIFRVDVLASASATSAKASYYLAINVPAADPKCVVSSQKLYVNGKAQTLSAYNIAGNNYLKLRDIAALLDGTVKEMKVDWDASKWTASMAMPGTFVKRGDELTTLSSPKKYELSTHYFTYNTLPVYPLAYNVTGTGDATGSNYVMLRDVASLLNFGVTYNAASQSINIDTASKYTPGL